METVSIHVPADWPPQFVAGCVLLHAVSRNDLAQALKLLEESPGLIGFEDYDQRSALHVASSEGHAGIVRMLVTKGAAINSTDRWGGTPLDDAMRHRHVELAAYLRAKGGKLGTATTGVTTPLIIAAARGDPVEVERLLNAGAEVAAVDYDGRTPLHLAAAEGHTEVLQTLLRGKADPNCRDRKGSTPLDEATRRRHVECVRLLREAGGQLTEPVYEDSAAIPPNDSVHKGTRLSQDAMIVKFDELELLDKVGSGSFGEIYKARWRGTYVACKVLRKGQTDAQHKVALRDLKSECMLLRQLRHPNICMLLGVCLEPGKEAMVSELMKCSLSDVFKSLVDQHLPKAKAIKYAMHFAQGMNYLHLCKPPILHRDLKPPNLLLDFSDTLKVADFGMAKLRPLPLTSKKGEMHMTGELGTYRFMAPEVYRHESYDEKVDVYSFALIVYQMLSGVQPFAELNGLDAARAAAMEKSRPRIPRHWDRDMIALLQDAWVDDPLFRPSFSNIVERLEVLQKVDSANTVPAGACDSCCTIS